MHSHVVMSSRTRPGLHPTRLQTARLRRSVASWSAIVIALVSLVSLGILTHAQEVRVLTVMDWKVIETQQTQAWFQAVKERFEADHPGVVVEYWSGTWGDAYRHRIVTGVLTDTAPDVVSLSIVWAMDLFTEGYLLPLNDLVASTPELAPEQFVPATQVYNQRDGVIFGITTAMDTNALFYDLDAFEEAGLDTDPYAMQTWDDFVDAARKLTRRNGQDVVRYGYSQDLASMEAFSGWLTSNGGTFYTDDLTQAAFNTPQGMETARHIHGLFAESQVMGGNFFDGTAAMGFGGNWNPYFLAQSMPELRFNMTSLPVGPMGSQRGSTTWGNMMSIPASSKNVDLAWEFIQYYAGLQGNIDIYKALGTISSPRLDFYQSDEWRRSAEQNDWLPMIPQIAVVGGVYPFQRYTLLTNAVWNPLMTPALNGLRPIETTLHEAVRLYNDILAE